MRAIRRFHVRTVLPEPIAALGELSTNLHWSWQPRTRDLFESIDPVRWAEVHEDPTRLLSRLSAQELDALAADSSFVERVREVRDALATYLTEDRWYQSWSATLEPTPGEDAGRMVAPRAVGYFSPEFGITHVLPQYSGGLGILAGDHLKAASDLGVPVVAVGLFYKTGYFRQSLTRDGWQQENYPVLDPDGLPLALLREPDGTPSIVELRLAGGRLLRAHVWRAQVGRVPLLLLDSDVPGNDDAARAVTEALYGGGGDRRLEQELLLGIGGVRALRLWSRLSGTPEPDVYHTNEGHAGFLGIERISELVTKRQLLFDEALEAVRASTVFTTHTPVPAGIDRFPADRVGAYLGGENALPGVPLERLLALGAETYAGGTPGMFNMAVMGLRLAQRANGVSVLHGQVSREMFHGLWPGFDDDEVPITSITNGVHAPTWVDRRMIDLGQRAAGTRNIDRRGAWDRIPGADLADLWATKRSMRESLVLSARGRMRAAWLERGASPAELGWVEDILDPDVLTVGFARRVPSYKRLTLMLRDPQRLRKILLDEERPVQLVIAGKSHPADDTGKRLIQQMVAFADDPQIRHRIAFLPDYDMRMAQVLYPGCDVWLNNPLRPFEACGTSGMKAALNGALNLSVLDGWWDEWYDGQNGWAIPTADGVANPERRDDLEAAALYDLLEDNVRTAFYERDERGLPVHWLENVLHTLQTLGPKLLAARMVRDYTTKLYAPAAASGSRLDGTQFAGARELAAYKAKVRQAWPAVRVYHVDSSGMSDVPQIGERLTIDAFVDLGALAPDDVLVQVVHGHLRERDDQLRDVSLASLDHVEGFGGGRHRFSGTVTLSRTGSFGYTVRVLPCHPGLAGSAELGLVANA